MKRTARFITYIVYSFILYVVFVPGVHAAVSSCDASITPSNVTPSSSGTYSVSFVNTSGETISWMHISRPSDHFTITGNSIGGWSVSQSASDITLTGQSVSPSGGGTLEFTVQTDSSEQSGANWTVQVSDNESGDNPTSCTGSLSTSISSTPPDTSGPGMSDLVVSDITDSGAKITWTTDESSSTAVDYGTSDGYGSTATGDGNTTSHSVTISGLSANTTYHYNVRSADGSGNETGSGDNTFTTAKSGYSGTTTTGTVTTVTRTIILASPTPIPDRTGPSVSISTKLEKTYKTPPDIEGVARDASGVVSIEYSLDGGMNYLPVEDATGYGKTSVSFTVAPFQTDDGNYTLVFRASDGKGNISTVKKGAYVIDRLPPQFGATIVTNGSQVIEPQGESLPLVTSLEYQLTTSVIGGAVSMVYSIENSKGEVAEIPARKNVDTGLWKASVHIDDPGIYRIYGSAIDGAANKTIKELLQVIVMKSGTIKDNQSHPIERATVEVFVKNTSTNSFVSWDGSSYGQQNPMRTDASGSYAFILPKGTYYIRVYAFGYRNIVSDIATFDHMTALTQDISISRAFGIQLGSWIIPLPDFTQTNVVLTGSSISAASSDISVKKSLRGEQLPFFSFPFEGKQISSLDLRGKPSIITLLNTWSPLTPSQLAILDNMSGNASVNLLVIVPHESAASVSTFMKRGAYTFRMVADPDGTLIEPLQYRSSPLHMFVNRKGIITAVIQGLATKEKMMDTSKE